MRLAVVSQLRPGSSRAHAINVIKTAGGLARLGHDVTLYTLASEPGADAARLYHEPDLRWVAAPFDGEPVDDERFGRWAADAVARQQPDLTYARNFWAPLLLCQRGLPCVLETHAHVDAVNPLLDACLRATQTHDALRGVVTIAPILRDHYIARGARADRVHVVPDGVDFDLFIAPNPTPYAPPGPHIVYAGHLYDYKGIPTILDAARLLPEAHFHLVGGLPEDIRRTHARIDRESLTNVSLHGCAPHADVPPFVQHADVLLLPPSNTEASKDWTSPVKLGEYLATGVPIVASDIPALTRVLAEPTVRFFRADDAASLAQAIRTCLTSPAFTNPAVRTARIELARSLSYPARAARILAAASPAPLEQAA